MTVATLYNENVRYPCYHCKKKSNFAFFDIRSESGATWQPISVANDEVQIVYKHFFVYSFQFVELKLFFIYSFVFFFSVSTEIKINNISCSIIIDITREKQCYL